MIIVILTVDFAYPRHSEPPSDAANAVVAFAAISTAILFGNNNRGQFFREIQSKHLPP